MKALVMDGERVGESRLRAVRAAVEGALASAGWEVETLPLREMVIAPCTGCFKCWLKTPGVCVIDDDGREVTRRLVTSDLLVILTPVTFGGHSSLVKAALDRSLGMMLPYFTKIGGHIHHRARYDRYPDMLAVGVASRHDEGTGSLFREIVARNATNAHAPRHAAGVVEETADEGAVGDVVHDLLRSVGVVR